MATNDVQEHTRSLRQAAADELAGRLKGLADQLAAAGRRPKRVWFGRERLKRRSPAGFVLDSFGPQILLPDGRLWHYHSRGNPEGRYFDARVDHTRSMHGPIPLGDARFAFLGAAIHKYSFGYTHRDGERGAELCAISGKTDPPRYVSADDAFADIYTSL